MKETFSPLGFGWLDSIQSSTQHAILEKLKFHQYKKNEFVHYHGEEANGLYFVKQGTIRIKKQDEAGKELIIKDLLGGEWFGFIGCFGSGKRPNDALAIEESLIGQLSSKDLNLLIKQDPQLTLSIANLLAGYVEHYNRSFENAVFLPLNERLNTLLLQLSRWQKSSELNVSQQELAGMLGVTKEAIGINLNLLKTQGVIEIGYRKIIYKPQAHKLSEQG